MSERPKEHDWKSCVPRKGTEGSNPSLCAKAPRKRGVFSLIRRFYAEFLVFRLAKLCTRMRVNSEGNFYIAMPCEALANIHIYAALRTTCNKISKIFLSIWQMFVRACRAGGAQDNKKDGHSPSFLFIVYFCKDRLQRKLYR